MANMYSTVKLQDVYFEQRNKVAHTMLSVCVADHVDQDVVRMAIYSLISFGDFQLINELFRVLIRAKKTDALRIALWLYRKITSSPVLLIDHIRSLDDDDRIQVITLLGIQGANIDYEISERDQIMEWFFYNDPKLEVREVAGKYLTFSKRDEWFVFGVPSLGCIVLALLVTFGPAGLAAGVKSGTLERVGALSIIAICISPIYFVLSVLLLNLTRKKPLIRVVFISAMILLVVFLYLQLY